MPATRGQVAFSGGKTVVSLFKGAFLNERKKFRLKTIGWHRVACCGWDLQTEPWISY